MNDNDALKYIARDRSNVIQLYRGMHSQTAVVGVAVSGTSMINTLSKANRGAIDGDRKNQRATGNERVGVLP